MIDVYGYRLDDMGATRWQQAARRARQRDFDGAVDLLDLVLGRQPGFVPASIQAAHWLFARGRYRDARARAREAVDKPLASFPLTLEAIRLLRRFEDGPCIERVVSQTDWTRCGSADVLTAVAGELAPIGLHGHAIELLDRAEALVPELAAVIRLRGTIELLAGRAESARALLQRALSFPGAPEAHLTWLMSLQPEDTAQARERAVELQHRLSHERLSLQDEAHFAFAAHNLLHSTGQYEAAWGALERGCRAKRVLCRYREEQDERLFARLLERAPCGSASSEPDASDVRVIFIVGMHRSGTTLLERMLGGHRAIADGGESYGFSAALRYAADRYFPGVIEADAAAGFTANQLAVVAEEFREHARWRARGRRWVTEKLPSNFLCLGHILDALPEARVLHMRRDPVDTCFSNLRTYFSDAAPYSYDQAELARYYLRYQRLMRHWHSMWPGRILDVDYDSLVETPEIQARRILDFCGLRFEAGVLELGRTQGHVATASLGTVRTGFRKDRGGVWMHYEQHLGPLVDALRPAYS